MLTCKKMQTAELTEEEKIRLIRHAIEHQDKPHSERRECLEFFDMVLKVFMERRARRHHHHHQSKQGGK